jgi:hypothetical protein
MTKLDKPVQSEEIRREALKGVAEVFPTKDRGYIARKVKEKSTRNKAKRRARKEEALP